jgi:hypothetical protein
MFKTCALKCTFNTYFENYSYFEMLGFGWRISILTGTVFGLSQTFGAAGNLAASYVVKEGLHGSVSSRHKYSFQVRSSLCFGLPVVRYKVLA